MKPHHRHPRAKKQTGSWSLMGLLVWGLIGLAVVLMWMSKNK